MAFDAGMLACVIAEIKKESLGARVEKIYQPEKDEIVIQIRSISGGKRILINAGSNNPRICFSSLSKENPANPPMFCMLLRKHLQGAKLTAVDQEGFERVVTLEFEGRDELGFECKKYLIAEVMGKYSNLIFADANKRIVSALKIVDFTTSSQRQVLSGMLYELPPKQQKLNPIETNKDEFLECFNAYPKEKSADRFITDTFLGIASVVAREICYRATKHTDTPLTYTDGERLYEEFDRVISYIKDGIFAPCTLSDGEKYVEYSFFPILQYGSTFEAKAYESAGEMLDAYFVSRDNEQRVRQRASDILKLLTNAEARITKKLEIQESELADCEKGETYRKYGDLITSNLYMLERGMKRVKLTDYEVYDEECGRYGECEIELDERLSPSANAQRFYKRYNKSKNAKVELTKQIAIAKTELEYIGTVFEALTLAETPTDLAEIREELYRSGYASKMKNYTAKKQHAPVVAEFRTSGGYRVLCGKNNTQNEYITHKVAEKSDYWFHVKNMPGSHTLLICNGEEPPAADFTEAAEIAAHFSKATGENIAVDYTFAKNVKRVAGAKPGFVIYHTNWTAYVTPDAEKIAKMRVK